ncbi:hypothetical protein K1T71_011898 [Dendrolimus kikuchii]|uniref:Uncharacterized protein n=1 Tax=Dendrolimus kikuchii TaxID=765133 RepID=A0ACC1CMB5_9NEOP|nr:hypothetical protein K1T71_011898 [Dendrolimus kikuchii]
MFKVVIIFLMVSISMAKKIDEDMFLYWRRSEIRTCEPFTTFKVECNSCVCNADGIVYCTKMACLTDKTQFFSTDFKKEPVVNKLYNHENKDRSEFS